MENAEEFCVYYFNWHNFCNITTFNNSNVQVRRRFNGSMIFGCLSLIYYKHLKKNDLVRNQHGLMLGK